MTDLVRITQVGRAFSLAHPDVPVRVDHGRHLVVEAAAMAALPAGDGLCWRAEPLPEGTPVVDVPARRPARAVRAVAALAGLVSRDALAADIGALAALPTRHSTSQHFPTAADMVAGRLQSLGFTVARAPIVVGPGTSQNVVAERAGSGPAPRRAVVVTAHLDSVNLPGGPAAPAPGADDNASGAAGVLELARVLATRGATADLRVILFGGEEQGLHGSRQYVAGLALPERARIRAVLNLDMVARRNADPATVLCEGAPVSSSEIADLVTAAATYTRLHVETSLSPFASDHVPFLDAGIPAVLTIEGGDGANADVHTERDVVARLDLDLAVEILRMDVAALAGWLGAVDAAAGVPRPAGPVVSTEEGRLDVFTVGADSTLRHTRWDGTAWQPGGGELEDLGGTLTRP